MMVHIRPAESAADRFHHFIIHNVKDPGRLERLPTAAKLPNSCPITCPAVRTVSKLVAFPEKLQSAVAKAMADTPSSTDLRVASHPKLEERRVVELDGIEPTTSSLQS